MKQSVLILLVALLVSCTKEPPLNSTNIEGSYHCTDTFYSSILRQTDSPGYYVDTSYFKSRTINVSKQNDGSYLIDQNVYWFNNPYGYSHVSLSQGGRTDDTLYVDGSVLYHKYRAYAGPNQYYQLVIGKKVE